MAAGCWEMAGRFVDQVWHVGVGNSCVHAGLQACGWQSGATTSCTLPAAHNAVYLIV
jgi:hypothetical protein